MSGVLRMGWLFFLFVLFAAGFARYFVLALVDDDHQLAIAAAVAFLLACAAAVMDALGWM